MSKKGKETLSEMGAKSHHRSGTERRLQLSFQMCRSLPGGYLRRCRILERVKGLRSTFYMPSCALQLMTVAIDNRDSILSLLSCCSKRFSVLGAVYTEIRKSPRHAVPFNPSGTLPQIAKNEEVSVTVSVAEAVLCFITRVCKHQRRLERVCNGQPKKKPNTSVIGPARSLLGLPT